MIEPYGSRCLVERVKTDATTNTGFAVTEELAPASIKAKVLAVGKEVKETRVGDEVFVSQYAPTSVKERPFDKTLMVPEEDILGKVVPDKTVS